MTRTEKAIVFLGVIIGAMIMRSIILAVLAAILTFALGIFGVQFTMTTFLQVFGGLFVLNIFVGLLKK